MSNMMDDLLTIREQGIIRDIDLEICRFLEQQHSDISEEVLLAACLVSYHYRQGNVCLLLEDYASQLVFGEVSEVNNIRAPDLDQWYQKLAESTAVGSEGGFKPLILDANKRLYLHKLWHYENILAEQLLKRSSKQSEEIDFTLLRDGLDRLFSPSSERVDWQQVGAVNAVVNKLSIISGGPGTGKTSTVVRVLALLLEQAFHFDMTLNIALVAPTGKAAARLKESIMSARDDLEIAEEIREAIPDKSKTIHQLLGARRHTTALKFDDENPLPHNVVVVDEASMVDQALMSKLMNALLENSRLILLGDKDQLASVEAGSVLGDICGVTHNQYSKEGGKMLNKLALGITNQEIDKNPNPLTDNITLLAKSYRFEGSSGIAQLADSVNDGNPEKAIEVLEEPDLTDVSLTGIPTQSALEEVLKSQVTEYFKNILETGSPDQALQALNSFRILAAHRRGPWGIEYLNRLVEKMLQQERLIPKYSRWYPGKPIIINVNDYTLGLHNGDIGLCLRDKDGELKVYFRHEDQIRVVAPGRLPEHNTAFALTVHKSQGSEFEKVMFILPSTSSKVLSRELVYTAITRSRTSISIISNKDVLRHAIREKIQRSSGLRDRLWG